MRDPLALQNRDTGPSITKRASARERTWIVESSACWWRIGAGEPEGRLMAANAPRLANSRVYAARGWLAAT